jgi:DNA-binding transcriptional regulator YhcF (GntR family)
MVSQAVKQFLEEMRALGFKDGDILPVLEGELMKGGQGNV